MTKIERWKPEYGEVYYFITRDFKCSKAHWCIEAFADTSRYKTGNCFRTEKEVQAAAEKVKALLLSLHDNGNNLVSNSPDKPLPDWCKVGAWVWTTTFNDYFKVDKVDELFVGGESLDSSDYSVTIENARQARLRPYTADEMRALVGKVIKYENTASLVIACLENGLIRAGVKWVSAEGLIEDGYTIDGKPCGKLEHLENGEWVK